MAYNIKRIAVAIMARISRWLLILFSSASAFTDANDFHVSVGDVCVETVSVINYRVHASTVPNINKLVYCWERG